MAPLSFSSKSIILNDWSYPSALDFMLWWDLFTKLRRETDVLFCHRSLWGSWTGFPRLPAVHKDPPPPPFLPHPLLKEKQKKRERRHFTARRRQTQKPVDAELLAVTVRLFSLGLVLIKLGLQVLLRAQEPGLFGRRGRQLHPVLLQLLQLPRQRAHKPRFSFNFHFKSRTINTHVARRARPTCTELIFCSGGLRASLIHLKISTASSLTSSLTAFSLDSNCLDKTFTKGFKVTILDPNSLERGQTDMKSWKNDWQISHRVCSFHINVKWYSYAPSFSHLGMAAKAEVAPVEPPPYFTFIPHSDGWQSAHLLFNNFLYKNLNRVKIMGSFGIILILQCIHS